MRKNLEKGGVVKCEVWGGMGREKYGTGRFE